MLASTQVLLAGHLLPAERRNAAVTPHLCKIEALFLILVELYEFNI
jgi:hypothetical protein